MSLFSEHPRATAFAAIALLLIAGSRLVRQGNRAPHVQAAVSYYNDMVLQAELATADLPDGAEVVILGYDKEMKLASEKNFRRVYRSLESKGLSVLHVESLVYDEETGWIGTRYGFPYHEFLRVVREHPDADAVLSLCGIPYGFEDAVPGEAGGRPPLLIARIGDGKERDFDRPLQQGWIQAVVLRQESAVSGDGGTASGNRFHVLTSVRDNPSSD